MSTTNFSSTTEEEERNRDASRSEAVSEHKCFWALLLRHRFNIATAVHLYGKKGNLSLNPDFFLKKKKRNLILIYPLVSIFFFKKNI